MLFIATVRETCKLNQNKKEEKSLSWACYILLTRDLEREYRDCIKSRRDAPSAI